MAEKGKRLIFSDGCTLPAQEGNALVAGILPGSLVVHNATGTTQYTQAATVFGNSVMVADYDILHAGTVDDAWTDGEVIIARALPKDKKANVRVTTGQNITRRGMPLSSNGDGSLKIALTDGTEQIIAYSDEIINVTAADTLVRVRGA